MCSIYLCWSDRRLPYSMRYTKIEAVWPRFGLGSASCHIAEVAFLSSPKHSRRTIKSSNLPGAPIWQRRSASIRKYAMLVQYTFIGAFRFSCPRGEICKHSTKAGCSKAGMGSKVDISDIKLLGHPLTAVLQYWKYVDVPRHLFL